MSKLYSMKELIASREINASVYIVAPGEDERATATTNILAREGNNISSVVLIKYGDYDEKDICDKFPECKIYSIEITPNISDFVLTLQKYKEVFLAKEILIDITSIRIPELFALMKFMKIANPAMNLSVSYSTPVEYEFLAEPFTSYRSYFGNLRTTDIVGFGGISTDMSYSKMIIFLGFEGVLSTKVSEDVKYDNLILVNNLPSFYEKYKDISVINNYEILGTRHERISYVPANNPFETYNFLCEQLSGEETACVAPLSTKPVALGVCLYALAHEYLRVVYPMADEYNRHRANSVHKTYLYKFSFNDVCI